MTRHVVVVGAGQAGLALVARLRAEGFDGPITLIGAEPHPPYERPPLTKAFLLGALPRERLRPGVEARTAAPLMRVVGDPDLARAVWAFAHGMVVLELEGRFPPTADLDAAWAAGIAAFAAPPEGSKR